MFTPVSLDLGGLDATKATLKRLGPLAGQEIARAMLPELKAIFADSQGRIAVRTGRAKGSGRVVVPRVFSDAVVGRVTYGAKGLSYLVVIHQKPGGASYKFLEAPFKARAAGLEGRLGAAAGKGIERGAA